MKFSLAWRLNGSDGSVDSKRQTSANYKRASLGSHYSISEGGIEQPLRCGAERLGWEAAPDRAQSALKNKALLTKTIDRTDIQFNESLEVEKPFA
jgi:hypothetical protein